MDQWPLLFLYAAVVAVVVRAFTQEEIAREPREWFERYAADPAHSWLLRKLAYMPTCEFCLSFWVTLGLVVGLFDYRLVFTDWRGWLVSVFATMAVVNAYLSLFNLLRVDIRRDRAVAQHVERRRAS